MPRLTYPSRAFTSKTINARRSQTCLADRTGDGNFDLRGADLVLCPAVMVIWFGVAGALRMMARPNPMMPQGYPHHITWCPTSFARPDSKSSTNLKRNEVSRQINSILSRLGSGWMIQVEAMRVPITACPAPEDCHFPDRPHRPALPPAHLPGAT